MNIVEAEIKTLIIGGASPMYEKQLKSLISEHNLYSNIVLAGFQKKQSDVFKLALKGKIYVLPSYFDATPGSIREAMYLKLPVVSYNVGGIPISNKNKECIVLLSLMM